MTALCRKRKWDFLELGAPGNASHGKHCPKQRLMVLADLERCERSKQMVRKA